MSAPLAFGPGKRSKEHPMPEARDRSALVIDYGRKGVTFVDASPAYERAPIAVTSVARVEFDNWYSPDKKTPPAKVAEIIKQHARRLGATPQAIEVLRQFVSISKEEEKIMTAIAETTTKPNFGAPASKKSVAEAKPAKAAATKAETPKVASTTKTEPAPKTDQTTKAKDAAPKAEKAKAAPATPKKEVVVSFKKMPPKDVKLPPQARRIVEVLKAQGPKMEKSVLLKALEGEIQTKQGVDRVFAFYQKQLTTDGYITVA